MKHFTRHPSKVTAATDILSFKCPGCKNKTLYSAEQDVHKVADVDENELFICDECGGEFRAHPQYNGSIRFTESIESATSVDDKKIDRRLSSTSKRYKGYRISLDNRHECYNIYDAHGELEDHGFKSVDDAMAHIDELVSIESATDNVYSSKQPGVRRKSTHRPVTAAKKRIARIGEWDNGHVIRNDWRSMSPEDAEEEARKQSLKDPEGTYYVAYDDVMNPCSLYSWKNGKKVESSTCISNGTCRVTPKGQSDLHDVVNSATDENSSTHVRVILNSGINADGFDVEVWKDNKCVYNESYSYGYNVSYNRAHAEQAQRDVDNAKKYKWSHTPTARPYVADVIQDICNKYGVSVSDVEVIAGKNSFKGQNVDNSDIAEFKRMIMSATDPAADYEDDIQEISQEFTSENTSINSSKLPAIFKMVTFQPGTINIDYGGGRFDNVADYLTQFDVINLVYDPYNRTPEHNKDVIRTVRKAGGADTATCSNVLNVIKEPEVRQNVLQNIKKLVKPNGTVYITVYEGSGKGNEGPTKSGYQLNKKTEGYLDEIKQVFPDAVRKGKLIVAHPNGSAVTSAEDLSYDALTCEDCTYDLWTLVQDDSGEWVREDKIDTYDDYDTAEAEAEAIAKDTPCQVIEVGPNGLALVWTSKVSDPAIIEWLHDEYTMGNTKYSQLVSDLVDNFSLSTDEADQIISDWIDKDEDVHLEYDENDDIEECSVVEGADYGGAYDIELDQFFTKEDIVEFGNAVADRVSEELEDTNSTFVLSDVYMDTPTLLHVEVTDNNMSYSADVVVDMRRIRKPRDLHKYETDAVTQIEDDYRVQNNIPLDAATHIKTSENPDSLCVDDYPEPPESNEPEERDSKEEIIIELDDDIVVEDNGDSVEFLRDPAFLEDEDEWTPEDEPMFQIDDGDSVYEHVMDLIIDSIPGEDGKYHIKGRLKLVYDVTLSYYYYEGTSEEDQTTKLNEDGSSSVYDKYQSEVMDLDVTEI